MYNYGEIGHDAEEFDLELDKALEKAAIHSIAMGERLIEIRNEDEERIAVAIEGELFKKISS